MMKFVTTKGVWLLVAVLAFSLMACTDEESKAISAVGGSDTVQLYASVQGVVKDICTGEAVSGVRVTMAYNGKLHEFWTDTSGLYAFDEVPVNTGDGDYYYTTSQDGGSELANDDVAWDNPGNYYTIVADFTRYLENSDDPSTDYNTTYVGYVMLVYETLDDGIGDFAEDSTPVNSMTLTVTGSGAATAVGGLASGMDILVSKKNAGLSISAVRSAIDNSTVSAATFGLYAANNTTMSQDDVFVQSLNWSGSAITVSNLEGGKVYYLRVLDEELAFYNDYVDFAGIAGSDSFFGGSANDLTADSSSEYGDNLAFMIHCYETAIVKCVSLMPAPCADVVNPWIVDYSPKHRAVAAASDQITVTFSEAMNTSYPPVETNPSEFLAVIVLDYRIGGSTDYGAGDVYTPVAISAEWTNNDQTLVITPGSNLPTGSRVMVALEQDVFTDANGLALLYDSTPPAGVTNPAVVGAAVYDTVPFNQSHSGTSLTSAYAWVGGQMIDWYYYVECDTAVMGLNIPISGTSVADVAYDPAGDYIVQFGTDQLLQTVDDAHAFILWVPPQVILSETETEDACILAYRIYVSVGADIDCEMAVLYTEITEPAGDPVSYITLDLQDIMDNTSVMNNWVGYPVANFMGMPTNTFVVGVSAVNCNGEESGIASLLIQDVTGNCLYAAGYPGGQMAWTFVDSGADLDGDTTTDAPYQMYFDCEPPAGYFQVYMDGVVSDDTASIQDSNFVIINGMVPPAYCEWTNEQDPNLSFYSFIPGMSNAGFWLYCDNLWLVDTGDILSVTGTDATDAAGVTDLLGNVTGICGQVELIDYAPPVIRNVVLDPRGYAPVCADGTIAEFDQVTVTITEELDADTTIDGWWEIGGTPLSAWTLMYDVNGPFAQNQVIDGGVKYPSYTYNTTTGESTVVMFFDDHTLNLVESGDDVVLVTGGADDKSGNPLSPIALLPLDDNGAAPVPPLTTWDDATDNIPPAIGGANFDADCDGVADVGVITAGDFDDTANVLFTIVIGFTENVNVSAVVVEQEGNSSWEDDWDLDDIIPDASVQAEYTASLNTPTLTLTFDPDVGAVIAEGDEIVLSGITDIAGNVLNPAANAVEAEAVGNEPTISGD